MDIDRQACIDNLMASYADLGVVNLADGHLVPSRQRIVDILNSVKELLFPGFFGVDALTSSDLSTVTGKRVVALIESLSLEIEKSFEWLKQEEGQHAASLTSVEITKEFVSYIPELRKQLKVDAQAIYDGDPAAKGITEIILAYPGFQAIIVYRVANFLYKKEVPLIPRLMTEIVHSETGIDIHPGATIGSSFCIDHGTGIVIGETAIIGDHVKLYQGVTLGAFSVSKKDATARRHPKLGDHVTVYARSTILGGETDIGDHCVIGGNVWLVESLPPKSTIYLSSDYRQIVKKRQAES
jgi:serine O-acetyltransferase